MHKRTTLLDRHATLTRVNVGAALSLPHLRAQARGQELHLNITVEVELSALAAQPATRARAESHAARSVQH